MKYEAEIQRLLDEHGAVLSRTNRHNVYKFPDGRIFTMSKTPSDYRTAMEQLQDLRKVLGIADPERGQPGERRPRKTAKPPERKPRIHAAPQNGTLAEQLRVSGVEADVLRDKIAEQAAEYAQLRTAFATHEEIKRWYQEQLDALTDKRRACWMCRLHDWWAAR